MSCLLGRANTTGKGLKMSEHDLYGILAGEHHTPPAPGMRFVVGYGLTAVLAAKPEPVMRLPQSRKAQLTALAERLRAQEACMSLGTLLPAGPRTRLSPDQARILLQANQLALHEQIALFAGLVQYQLQIAWAEDRVLERFRHEPELRPLFDNGPLRDAAEIPRAVTRLATRLGDGITMDLAFCEELLPLPLAPGLLWNGALLLPLSAADPLDKALLAIDALWPEGLTLRLTGPAPILSFCMLDLEAVSPAQVEEALQLFGLHSLTQMADLPAARRRLLMSQEETLGREEIDLAMRWLEAAARLEELRGSFLLCHFRAEGEALSRPLAREVA